MARSTGLFLAALFLVTVPLAAQTADGTPPMKWVATPCPNWNCALVALVEANGDPDVIALPTRSTEHPWIVLKRIMIGFTVNPEPETFMVECFSGVSDASARFSAIEGGKYPMLITTPDGSIAVICLHQSEPKRRAVRR